MNFCSMVAILGAPNAGKSTFVNYVTGQKVAIVCDKPNTTRNSIYGIACQEDYQIIFVDTPGLILSPDGLLQKTMSRIAWKSSKQSDVCLIMIDCKKPDFAVTDLLVKECLQRQKPLLMVLNKMDLLPKDQILPLIGRYAELQDQIVGYFPVSCKTGKGIDVVMDQVKKLTPQGPWLFPKEDVTQVPWAFSMAEITREKVFSSVHQEIPYGTHVETEDFQWSAGSKKTLAIWQAIFVQKEGHRKLVLGHHGRRIKHIGSLARMDMEDFNRCPVYLTLFVKVDPAWSGKYSFE